MGNCIKSAPIEIKTTADDFDGFYELVQHTQYFVLLTYRKEKGHQKGHEHS